MARLLLLACVWLGCFAEPARAQAAPASDQLHAAVRAYEAGRLDEARALFEELHARAPTARTLRGLGVIAFRQGRFVAAVPLLEASLSSTEKPLTPELARATEAVLGDARKQIGRVVLVALDPQAEVRVDGHEPGRDSTGALLLMPGAHLLVITRAGYLAREQAFALHAGSQLVLDASLAATPAAVATSVEAAPAATNLGRAELPTPASVPEASRPSLRSVRQRRLRRTGYALLGLGASALLTSLAATAAGIKRVGAIESFCRSHACTEEDVDQRARAEKLDLLSALSIGGVALGAASAASGLVLWLTVSRDETRLDANPARAALSLQFRGSF